MVLINDILLYYLNLENTKLFLTIIFIKNILITKIFFFIFL